MKITFPHMSPVPVYKKLVELLGHEPIVPPRPTQETIDLGVKYSPEFACFPLKVILGSYIEAIRMGAEMILTSGGDGPCRAGYYAELHKRILAKLGYNMDFIIFDSVFINFRDFMRKLKILKGDLTAGEVVKVLKTVYRFSQSLDRSEKKLQIIRAYSLSSKDCDTAWDKINKIYDKAYSYSDIDSAESRASELIEGIPVFRVKEENKIRVGIVGEIYVVLESSVNMEIEKVLGRLGAETERSQYLSEWIDRYMLPSFIRKAYKKDKLDKIEAKGEDFIKINIGGHAKETVGFIKDFRDRGFDGVIHLMPFGCLPELVTQTIVPSITEKTGMPVLTMPIDEQTGNTNNITRIEAFIDLIKSKKFTAARTAGSASGSV